MKTWCTQDGYWERGNDTNGATIRLFLLLEHCTFLTVNTWVLENFFPKLSLIFSENRYNMANLTTRFSKIETIEFRWYEVWSGLVWILDELVNRRSYGRNFIDWTAWHPYRWCLQYVTMFPLCMKQCYRYFTGSSAERDVAAVGHQAFNQRWQDRPPILVHPENLLNEQEQSNVQNVLPDGRRNEDMVD